jgi:hypothetical protein
MRYLRRFMPLWWAIHVAAVAIFFLLGMFLD